MKWKVEHQRKKIPRVAPRVAPERRSLGNLRIIYELMLPMPRLSGAQWDGFIGQILFHFKGLTINPWQPKLLGVKFSLRKIGKFSLRKIGRIFPLKYEI